MSENDDEPYEVGYRKPPRQTRFKKGQSGNPKGRKPRNISLEERLRAQLHKTHKLSDGSTTTAIDVIVARGVKDIASGHVKQWPQVFAFLSQFNPTQKFTPSSDDEQRLARILEEMAKPEQDDD